MKRGKIITPGESGFNDPRLPWGGLRNALGIPRPGQIKFEVHGFYLIDRRKTPPIAIFKNCEFTMKVGAKPRFKEPIQPFQYLGEALEKRRLMHLSAADEMKVAPVAMVPDPGMGVPKPDVMWIANKEAKDR